MAADIGTLLALISCYLLRSTFSLAQRRYVGPILMVIFFCKSGIATVSSTSSYDDHVYRDQIEAVIGELLALESDSAWTYHSVKQNVLISQLKGEPASSKLSFATDYMGNLNGMDRQKNFQRVRGQGIVHAPPEITFNCISDLDMYASWHGFSSQASVISEYSLGDEGLVSIVYIRFNGIFPLASRDLCICTCKRVIHTQPGYLRTKHVGNQKLNSNTKKTSNAEGDVYVLAAFSVEHPSCPPVPGYVRAELAASGFIIRPLPNSPCSKISYVVQFSAKGWIPIALQNMLTEYQPLRIATIRTVAHTYQQKSSAHAKSPSTSRSSSKTSSEISDANLDENLSSHSASSPTPSSQRFSWVQQCRGAIREEEEFIIAERQRLEDASAEMIRQKFRSSGYIQPTPHYSPHAIVKSSSSATLRTPSPRHLRSPSAGNAKSIDSPRSSSPRSGSGSEYHHRMSHDGWHTNDLSEGEGGETEWTDKEGADSHPHRSRSGRVRASHQAESSGVGLGDSDSDGMGSGDADSDDSELFFDPSADSPFADLLQPGSDGSVTLLKMMENDVNHIKQVQAASQAKLEAIEVGLRTRASANTRLLDHLTGLRSFLVACMEKLKAYASEHKTMEAMRVRLETKWHAKLANVAAKLNDAQRGYWSSKRTRQAVVYRYSTAFFVLIIWPIIFIYLWELVKKPQRALSKLYNFGRLVTDWLLPSFLIGISDTNARETL